MKWIDSQRLCVLDLSELLGNSVVYVGGTGIVQGILASFLVISSLEEHTAPSLLASHNEMRIRAHLLTELKTQLEWGYQFKLLMLTLHKWACCTKVKKIV